MTRMTAAEHHFAQIEKIRHAIAQMTRKLDDAHDRAISCDGEMSWKDVGELSHLCDAIDRMGLSESGYGV